MTKISILFPSRGRARQSHATAEHWISNIGEGVDYELILSIDRSDDQGARYKQQHRATATKILHEPNESMVQAANRAAEASTGDILILISDDFKAPKDWGLNLIRETNGKTDWIMKTQDGIQSWLITLPLMDRAYYNRFGYIYYPIYRHLFSDSEMSCVADITERKIVSKLVFPHEHYSVMKTRPDPTSSRADATWKQGEDLFIERYERNFDLPKGGKIGDQNMINWLINKRQRAI